MDFSKLKQLGPLTHIYLANGAKSARAITRKLLEKHGYTSCFGEDHFDSLFENVRGIFLILAEQRRGFVKLRSNPSDAIFIPVVPAGRIAAMEGEPISFLRPKVGRRVRFSLWHGNNAPEIDKWTGEIIQIRRESGLPMYQILRDYDREIIEVRKPFLYSYA